MSVAWGTAAAVGEHDLQFRTVPHGLAQVRRTSPGRRYPVYPAKIRENSYGVCGMLVHM